MTYSTPYYANSIGYSSSYVYPSPGYVNYGYSGYGYGGGTGYYSSYGYPGYGSGVYIGF